MELGKKEMGNRNNIEDSGFNLFFMAKYINL